MLFVELSTSKLIQKVFGSDSNVSRTILGLLQIVLIFFLAIEVISVFVGIVLTKSITQAVHNLYRGTEFVKRGDFSHRIVVKSNDQLGALAKSFNQMTDYVQSLVKERVEKERLQRELEIAKEVQEQLFPREAPRCSAWNSRDCACRPGWSAVIITIFSSSMPTAWGWRSGISAAKGFRRPS